jgi:hypothetical protein
MHNGFSINLYSNLYFSSNETSVRGADRISGGERQGGGAQWILNQRTSISKAMKRLFAGQIESAVAGVREEVQKLELLSDRWHVHGQSV